MSVLIKGMKTPKTCFDCPFMYHRTLCAANIKLVFDERDYSELKGRYDGCPLIELPDHGDLIDRDTVWRDMVQTESFQEAQNTLWNALVVIPAERRNNSE